MNFTLEAKSSGGGSYNVDFKEQDGLLRVWCDCQAGVWGKFCKHKWQLLNGNEKMLYNSSQIHELKAVNKLAIKRGLDTLHGNIEVIESEKKELVKNQKKAKVKFKKVLDKSIVLSKSQFLSEHNELFQIDILIAYTNYKMSKEKKIVEQKLKNGF